MDAAALDPETTVIHQIHGESTVNVDPDPEFARLIHRTPGWQIRTTEAAQRVIELESGVVFGIEGWVGPDTATICTDVNRGMPTSLGAAAREAQRALDVGLEHLPGTTVSAVVHSSRNYYHWLVQGLPMTSMVTDAIDAASIDRFLVVPAPPPFILESLLRLGVPTDRVTEMAEPAPAYRAERLLVGTVRRHWSPPPRWALDRVRGLFEPELARPAAEDRIYIRRGEGHARRRILNEPELVAALREIGFREVAMEGMTVAEQAALFAGAQAIVGLHGAALANIVFARPQTVTVEILPTNAVVPTYFTIAHELGLRYRPVLGTEPHPPQRLRHFIGDAHVKADIDGIVSAVVDGLDRR